MSRAVIGGMFLGILGVTLLRSLVTDLPAQGSSSGKEAQRSQVEMIAFQSPSGEGGQYITVVEPGSRRICVYHVEQSTGALELKSVRDMTWDLQMTEFNTGKPSPREIRAMLKQ